MSERPVRKVIDLSGNSDFKEVDGAWHVHFSALDLRAEGATRDEALQDLVEAIHEATQTSEEMAARWQEFAETHVIQREYTDEELQEEQDLKRRSKEAAAAFAVLTQDTLDEAIQGAAPLLVDFWAEWCMPCHMMAPELKAAADELGTRLTVAKLNVDEYKEAWERFSIEGIPTAILFQGGKEIHRILGAQPKDAIIQELSPHL